MAKLKQELTNKDLMEMFGISRRCVYNWRKIGLEFYKLPGNGILDPVRYSLDAVKKFAIENDKAIINQVFIN